MLSALERLLRIATQHQVVEIRVRPQSMPRRVLLASAAGRTPADALFRRLLSRG